MLNFISIIENQNPYQNHLTIIFLSILRPLTLAAFSGDSSVSAFSQPASATYQPPVQGSNKEENDYLAEQKKMLEAFEKKKQTETVEANSFKQTSFVPNPLNPPAGKQQATKPAAAISFNSSAPVSQPFGQLSGTNGNSSSSKPSNDLLMLSNNSQATSFTMSTPNFSSGFNQTSSYGDLFLLILAISFFLISIG